MAILGNNTGITVSYDGSALGTPVMISHVRNDVPGSVFRSNTVAGHWPELGKIEPALGLIKVETDHVTVAGVSCLANAVLGVMILAV